VKAQFSSLLQYTNRETNLFDISGLFWKIYLMNKRQSRIICI